MYIEHRMELFACKASRDFACKVVDELNRIGAEYGEKYHLGASEVTHFSDGEFVPSFTDSVRGATVFILQSTFPPTENLMELLLTIDAAKRVVAHYHGVGGGRHVFGIHYLHRDVEVGKDGLGKLRPELVAVLVNVIVELVNMEQAAHPSHHKLGQPAVKAFAFGLYHLVEVDVTFTNFNIFCSVGHFFHFKTICKDTFFFAK